MKLTKKEKDVLKALAEDKRLSRMEHSRLYEVTERTWQSSKMFGVYFPRLFTVNESVVMNLNNRGLIKVQSLGTGSPFRWMITDDGKSAITTRQQ